MTVSTLLQHETLLKPDHYGTYASSEFAERVWWPGKGRAVHETNHAEYLIYGANLGLGPNTIDSHLTWTTSWSWSYISANLDLIAKMGCNSVRVQGNYTSWVADPATYLARFTQLMEYCRTKGLRVLYAFLNNPDDTGAGNVLSTLRTSYQTMIAALAGPYAGDHLLIGWDVGNELNNANSDTVTLVTNFAADLRAVDPTTKVTASISGPNNALKTAAVTTWDSIVDFHDVHWYLPPTATTFYHNQLDDVRALTTKPILIGEFGANMNATQAGYPHVNNDESQQAWYFAAFLRFVAAPGVMGGMPWQIRSDTTNSDFGLLDVNGNIRKSFAVYAGYPRHRLDGAKALVDYRTVPVALDKFARANSSTSLGTAALGGAWTAGLGTWGLNSHLGKLITGDAGGHNVAVLETNSADVELEVEVQVAATYNVGIIFHYVDSTHYCLLQFAGVNLKVFENNAGTFTQRFATTVTSILSGSQVRLGVDLRGGTRTIYLGEEVITQLVNDTFSGVDATKHGIYVWSGSTPDLGSLFRRFTARIANRSY